MQIFNKRASYDYSLIPERIEAGISLKGIEAKAFRENRVNLNGAYIKEINGEIYLINANFSSKDLKLNGQTRARKLLLHKREILSLITKCKQKKLQIVPIKLYNTKRKIKLEIALGKPKRKFEKRADLKKKDIKREIERELREN